MQDNVQKNTWVGKVGFCVRHCARNATKIAEQKKGDIESFL